MKMFPRCHPKRTRHCDQIRSPHSSRGSMAEQSGRRRTPGSRLPCTGRSNRSEISRCRKFMADDSVPGGVNDPLAAKKSHFPAKARHVIFLFMTGGVSQVDTFDHKPRLYQDVGKEVKLDHPEIKNRPGYERIF